MPTTETKKTNNKTYDFGEKKEEYINGKTLPVTLITPKYKEAKKKVIELLESNEYKNILEESDFWILINTYANKTKVMYSGLIISHDGCLKINDTLDEKLKFRPECMSLDKDGYKNSLVFTYSCVEQGIYEVGEVSEANCKNDYPYAMALKRCFDRVVLKNSKIAYSGVYSDSEADEFNKRIDSTDNSDVSTTKTTKARTTSKQEIMIQDSQKEIIKNQFSKEEIIEYLTKLNKTKLSELTLVEASELIKSKGDRK